MIQATPVRAVEHRDDRIAWLVMSGNDIQQCVGISRMTMVCSRDGFVDVIIDSVNVPDAFSLATSQVVRGEINVALVWKPGVAVAGRFDQEGRWRATVYLFDGVHADGIEFGQFTLDVVFNTGSDMLIITPSSLSATVADAFEHALYISGGTPPYHFEMTAADPVDGQWLRISPAGLLYGVPLTPGPVTIHVNATDVDGKTGSATLSLSVSANAVKSPIAVWTTATWRGSPTYGSTTYLVDDTQNWIPGSLIGLQLQIIDLLGGPKHATVTITDNTRNTLVFTPELPFEVKPPESPAFSTGLAAKNGNAYTLLGPSVGNAGAFSFVGPLSTNYFGQFDNFVATNMAMWIRNKDAWGVLGMTQDTDVNYTTCAPGAVRGWSASSDVMQAMGGNATSWTVMCGMGLQLSAITKAVIGYGGTAPTSGNRYNRLLDIYYHQTNTPLATEFPPYTNVSLFPNFVDNGFYQAIAGGAAALITVGGVKWNVSVDLPAGSAFHQAGGHYVLFLARPDSVHDGLPETSSWGLPRAQVDLHAIQKYLMQSNPLDDTGAPLKNQTTGLDVTSPLLPSTLYLNAVNDLFELDFTGQFDDEYTNDLFWVAMQAEANGTSPGAQPLAMINGFVPPAASGVPYSYQLQGFGGTPPYFWSASIAPNSGSWLSLDTGTGILSGTPPGASTEVISLTLAHSAAGIFQKTFKLTVV